MPTDRTILQVGPILQIPYRARRRKGQWYVYLRSIDAAGVEHESGWESATAYPTKAEAHARMVLRGRGERMTWKTVRDFDGIGKPSATICYHNSREDAERQRLYPTDRAVPVNWSWGMDDLRKR